LIDNAVTFDDIDSNNLAGGTITVAIGNVVPAEDLLEIRNQDTAPGQISVVGADVFYNFGAGPAQIASFAGGTGGAPLVVNLNAAATPVAVDALIQNLTYGNASQTPRRATSRSASSTATAPPTAAPTP
jgi:hypothetical protein